MEGKMVKEDKEAILEMIDESLQKRKEGSIMEGKVVGISPAEAFIDIGCKSDGSVSLSEFDDPSSIKVGDKFEFLLEKVVEDEGLLFLSKRKADSLRVWDEIKKSYESKAPVEARVLKLVKGGCIVSVQSIEAFLPGSQIDTMEVRDMSKLIGETMSVRVTKFDRLRSNVVVSRKAILEQELRKKREELWDTVKEGEVLEGVVKSIVDFGAFIDVGGIDGLAHIADLSWGRVTHPSQVLRVGDKVESKILGVDKEEGHLTLGIKQLTPSPWENVEENYPINSRVKGKVTSLTDYGAFVELESGIEGLIHISEMSWTRIHSPSDILSVGDTVEVVVLNVDRLEEKISLGLRQTQPNPWEQVAEKYPIDSVVTGTVKSFSKFGAFIELGDRIEGLLHVSDLSWTEHVEHPGDVLRKKQQVDCKVLNLDVGNQRIALGLKQMETDPLTTLSDSIATSLKGKVKEIVEKGVIVKLQVGKYKVEGFVPSSHLVRPLGKNVKDGYEIGEDLDLKLLEADGQRRRVILSEKEYFESEEREDIQEYLKKSEEVTEEAPKDEEKEEVTETAVDEKESEEAPKEEEKEEVTEKEAEEAPKEEEKEEEPEEAPKDEEKEEVTEEEPKEEEKEEVTEEEPEEAPKEEEKEEVTEEAPKKEEKEEEKKDEE
jgi:small subunit ribosomal protein S1